jgi:hypothetical protein
MGGLGDATGGSTDAGRSGAGEPAVGGSAADTDAVSGGGSPGGTDAVSGGGGAGDTDAVSGGGSAGDTDTVSGGGTEADTGAGGDTGFGEIPDGCDFLSVTVDPPPCGGRPERCEQMAQDGSRRLFRCDVRDAYYTADDTYVELAEDELAERVACVASWLEILGATDVSSGGNLVSATGTWDQLAPLAGVEGTFCHPICGESACDYCYDLDEAGCEGDALCTSGFGSPIDLERSCIESSRFAVCRPAGTGCDGALTVALDDEGQCWFFSGICYDRGYTYDPDDSDCRDYNYPSCDGL